MRGIMDEKKLALDYREKGDFDGVKEHFNNFLELLNFSLIKNEPFYGSYFINMKRICDFKFPAHAGCNVQKGVMNFIYNPILLLDCTNEEIVAIIKHEIFHVINCHMLREKEMNIQNTSFEHHQVNIVMDVAINQLISNLPEWTWSLENFVKTYFPDKQDSGSSYYRNDYCGVTKKEAWEYYWNLLKDSDEYKEQKKAYDEKMKNLQDLQDMLNDAVNNGNGITKEQLEDILNKIGGKEGIMENSHKKWRESSSADIENMEELVKQMIQNVSDKIRGNIPSEVQQVFDKLCKPPVITWQEEFKNIIGSVKCPYKKTILRRPRRQMDRFDLKGRLSDRKIRVAVGIDTSGSVSETELQWIFNEIFAIIKTVKFELTIIECDCNIGKVYTAKNIKEVKTEVTGRGGTSFEPVFKYIKEEMKNKIDLLVYFTDGYGERAIDRMYEPKGFEVMWVLTNGEKDVLSLEKPFTKKIKSLHVNGKR